MFIVNFYDSHILHSTISEPATVKWFVFTREQKCCNTCKNFSSSKIYKLKTFALECTSTVRKNFRTVPGPLATRKKILMPQDYPFCREKIVNALYPLLALRFSGKNPECHQAFR